MNHVSWLNRRIFRGTPLSHVLYHSARYARRYMELLPNIVAVSPSTTTGLLPAGSLSSGLNQNLGANGARFDIEVAAINKTSTDFESSFLSNMLGQMFEGLDTSGPFGGGDGEAMFRSVMMDAFGKQISKSGGVGVAAAVRREMLKMQGLG